MDLDTDIFFGKQRPLYYAKILEYYLKHPNKTAYDYCRDNRYIDTSDERKAYRHIQQLAKVGLLEPVIGKQQPARGTAKNAPNPYQLSLIGIFHIVLNKVDNISYNIDIIKNLQKSYKENPLFRIFLHPVISEKTIDEIDYDVSFFSIIAEYLRNTCKDIISALRWLKSANERTMSSDGYFNNQIFVWYTDSRDNNNVDLESNIRFFLNTYLKWDNVDDSIRIEAKNNDNVVEIIDAINPSRNSTINIIERDRKAILRQGGKKIFEFQSIPNNGLLSIQTKGDTKPVDDINSSFLEICREHWISFLTKLRTELIHSNDFVFNPTSETLSNDERYNESLERLDKEFNLSRKVK